MVVIRLCSFHSGYEDRGSVAEHPATLLELLLVDLAARVPLFDRPALSATA
jgi:hypothetical protein